MKKELIEIAKKIGWKITVECERLDTHSLYYSVGVYNNDENIGWWDGHYFIGEVNSPNSKETVLGNFKTYLKSI